MIWKYKIELKDTKVFDKIEKSRGILFPEDLKAFVIDKNAATPEKYCFMVKSDERVVGAVLSFNLDEEEAADITTALEVIKEKNELPFAVDPFGNLFCYNLTTKKIDFWNHETDSFTSSDKTLSEFTESLY